MNIDTQFAPAAYTGSQPEPARKQTEQTTSRPVDRPHHDEAAGSESPPGANPVNRQDAADSSETAQDTNAGSTSTEQSPARGGFDTDPTRPASVGELLDVVA